MCSPGRCARWRFETLQDALMARLDQLNTAKEVAQPWADNWPAHPCQRALLWPS